MATERHLPQVHFPHPRFPRGRYLLLATAGLGLTAAAAFGVNESGILDSQKGTVVGNEPRASRGVDGDSPNQVPVLVPTELPTASPTQVPTVVPTEIPTLVPPTPTAKIEVQPTQIPPTKVPEAPKSQEGFVENAGASAITRLNQIRAERGLGQLRIDQRLSASSKAHLEALLARGMIYPDNNFPDDVVHNTGGSPVSWAARSGYNAEVVNEVIIIFPYAEILPTGQLAYIVRSATGADAVNILVTSPGHERAMMDPKNKDVGAACWVGRSQNGAPVMVLSCLISPAY